MLTRAPLTTSRRALASCDACSGLDDPELLPVWKEIERLEQVVFVHPHYGVGNEHFGDYGHTLFLALGFPFETTTAVRAPCRCNHHRRSAHASLQVAAHPRLTH